MKAVKKTAADAVHPGYGFLSENAEFCAALDAINCIFIGPSTDSMSKMGDKLESKAIARAASVNTIPGHGGVVQNGAEARRIAKDIGYPVMLKASAGGGGKGMRIAWKEEEIADAFRLASAEAKSSFADDRLLIERFIAEPRHVEFQILGDQHGNIIYLPERECSIQRRNQKVLEEAPSPLLDPVTRKAMGEQAVRLAAAVGYYSAGTVEFLVDLDRQFYFLEMNTRLQVEHPITELVTGMDLVEQMIRISSGEPLSYKQSDIRIKGWALESRVYAEDPKLYLPSIGTLSRYIEPSTRNVRCDSGVREGSEISVYYDPMICKLSTLGETRPEALANMAAALDHYVIRGVTHNVPLLREVVDSPDFKSGEYSTKYLSEHYPNGFDGHRLSDDERMLLMQIAVHLREKDIESYSKATSSPTIYYVSINGSEYERISRNLSMKTDYNQFNPVIMIDSDSGTVTIQRCPETPEKITFMGTEYSLNVLDELQYSLKKMLPQLDTDQKSARQQYQITSPMPGLVVSIAVKEGDVVREGREIAVIEAMKMQNVLKASAAGTVTKVNVQAGQTVGSRQLLVELEPF